MSTLFTTLIVPCNKYQKKNKDRVLDNTTGISLLLSAAALLSLYSVATWEGSNRNLSQVLLGPLNY